MNAENRLNIRTDETVKRIHLLTTRLCSRKCPYCCNNLFTDDMIPQVTDDELQHCEILFLTGGEPFQFSNPNEIAGFYKSKYKNIQKVIVYTNAFEFYEYLKKNGELSNIDGVSVSIKNKRDAQSFLYIKEDLGVKNLTSNRLYVFNELLDKNVNCGNFTRSERLWQPLETYKPAPDSIFRRI